MLHVCLTNEHGLGAQAESVPIELPSSLKYRLESHYFTNFQMTIPGSFMKWCPTTIVHRIFIVNFQGIFGVSQPCLMLELLSQQANLLILRLSLVLQILDPRTKPVQPLQDLSLSLSTGECEGEGGETENTKQNRPNHPDRLTDCVTLCYQNR